MGADGDARLAEAIFDPCGEDMLADCEGELYAACCGVFGEAAFPPVHREEGGLDDRFAAPFTA